MASKARCTAMSRVISMTGFTFDSSVKPCTTPFAAKSSMGVPGDAGMKAEC